MHLGIHIVEADGLFDQEALLGGVGLEKLFKGLEILYCAGAGSQVPLHQRVPAVVQGHFHGGHHIHQDGAGMAAVAAGDGGFHAADGAPVANVLLGIAVLAQRGEDRLIVVHGGCGRGGEIDLAQPADIGRAVFFGVDAGVYIGVVQREHLGNLQEDVGHVIDAVLARGSDPAQGDGLVGRRAAEKVVADIRRQGHVIGDSEVEAADQLNGISDIAATRMGVADIFHVRQQVGLQPLVQTPQGKTGIGILHMHADPGDPDALDGLGQAFGRLSRHLFAVGGHLEQLFAALRISGQLGLLTGLLCQVGAILRQAFQAVDHALQ